jgi:hypothetical protein
MRVVASFEVIMVAPATAEGTVAEVGVTVTATIKVTVTTEGVAVIAEGVAVTAEEVTPSTSEVVIVTVVAPRPMTEVVALVVTKSMRAEVSPGAIAIGPRRVVGITLITIVVPIQAAASVLLASGPALAGVRLA